MEYDIGDIVTYLDDTNSVINGELKAVTASVLPKEETFYHLELADEKKIVLIKQRQIPELNICIRVPLFNIGQTVGVESRGVMCIECIIGIELHIDEEEDQHVFYRLLNNDIVSEDDIVYAEPIFETKKESV